jgi:hypothetical protein
LTDTRVRVLFVRGSDLFAGSSGGGVFRSTDHGANWTQVNNGMAHTIIYDFTVSGTNLFAGTNGGVYLSDDGTNWIEVNDGLTNMYAYALILTDTNLFVGTRDGVFLSTDNGTSWVHTGLTGKIVMSFAVYGTDIFAGTHGDGLFLSTDNGASWTEINDGLTNNTILSFAVDSAYLIIGTDGGGVWKRPWSEMVTSVNRLSEDIPLHYKLEQNYPNPFNPSTMICFSMPDRRHVRLSVYDLLGREVSQLVDEEMEAGWYSVIYDAAGLASGVYLYRLEVGSFVRMRRMIILK